MTNGSSQMQRCGVNADDLVQRHHQRCAISEVFKLMNVNAESARFVYALNLHAVQLGVAQRGHELRKRHFARIVTVARLAYRPCDTNTFAAFQTYLICQSLASMRSTDL